MADLIHDFIFDAARRTPAAEALVDGSRRLDYAALADAVEQAAGAHRAIEARTVIAKTLLVI